MKSHLLGNPFFVVRDEIIRVSFGSNCLLELCRQEESRSSQDLATLEKRPNRPDHSLIRLRSGSGQTPIRGEKKTDQTVIFFFYL